jgi:large subunit ribosomal protein L17
VAPVVAARRRALQLLGDKEAVGILFEEVAPRYEDRPGGYTRILRLAKPRLGDAGERAILEFVGVGGRDRGHEQAAAPEFEDDGPKGKAAAKDKAAKDKPAKDSDDE